MNIISFVFNSDEPLLHVFSYVARAAELPTSMVTLARLNGDRLPLHETLDQLRLKSGDMILCTSDNRPTAAYSVIQDRYERPYNGKFTV